jgi:Spy/CpxP family protein refolding chaperone
MLGFLFGTACLIGLCKVLHGPCGRWHRWRRPPFSPFHDRWAPPPMGLRHGLLAWLSRAIDATPGQERVLLAAFERLATAHRKARTDVQKAMGALARQMGADAFDREAAQQELTQAHAELVHVEEAILDAAAEIHEALEPAQRRRLAELIRQVAEAGPCHERFARCA